ncbi:MAG: efflux family protein [Myxococcaceae bacterium]|nr:efflux family protein [Myxococcaceae bacterium]
MSVPDRPIPSFKALLLLAWPIVISRSSQVVVGVSDAIMVSHLGEGAVAAATTGALNTFAILIFPMGICFIVSSFSSQLFGKGDLAGARRYGFYGLGVAGLTQVACTVGVLGVAPLVAELDYAPDVRAMMIDYLVIRLLSGGAAIGIEALANYYGGLGNTRLPMIASVVAMVLNVFGNWVFINGHLGAPAMGVAGAALASTLSTSIAFLGLLAFFLVQGRQVGAVVPKLKALEFWRMLKFGVPSGLNWFFEFFAFNFFINVVVAGLGTTALAAMMSVLQIGSVSFMPAFALASAGAILTGQAIGADARGEVPRVVKLTFISGAIWETVVGVAYLAIPTLLLLPFAKDAGATEFLAIGKRLLMLSACWGLFDAAVNTLAEALRAAGDTAFTLWARLAIAWLVFVPGSYVTVKYFGGGDVGAMLWLIAYLGVLAGVLWWRFQGGAWRSVELVDHSQPAADLAA